MTGYATQRPRPDEEAGLTRAVEQPVHDLTLMRDQVPAVLRKAMSRPYDLRETNSCTQLAREISDLDARLAPTSSQKLGLSANKLAAGAIAGVIHLPYRGGVRELTGAEKRDRELHAAVQAGMVRRGFLKRRLSTMNCHALWLESGSTTSFHPDGPPR